MAALQMTGHIIAGIQTYVYGLDENPSGPVVIFLHGLRGAAQNSLKYCRDLAGRGYIALAFDQRNHGQRTVDLSVNQSGSDNYPVNTYGIYSGTAHDVSTIIDFLPLVLNISTESIGVCGFSLGAHASFVAAVIDERIKAVVPICGTGDRKAMLKQRFLATGGDASEFERSFPARMAAVLKKYDPVHNLHALKDRALCMINGGRDSIVPPDTNRCLWEKLVPLYNDQSKLVHSVYPDAEHEVTPEMWDECVEWFNRFLS